MPKENRKRGRRGDKKRKLEDITADDEVNHKRQKHHTEEGVIGATEAADFVPLDVAEGEEAYNEEQEGNYGGGPGERPFYGLLDEEEQEYFRKAGEMLDVDDFPDAQERSSFVESVFREADGKELKLANSQSCSRLFERLLRMASPKQMKDIFRKFSGNFVPLVQHRFASHCCETLFMQAAPIVTEEMTAPSIIKEEGEASDSMANAFLQAVAELKEYLGWLLTNKYASHPLRVLLLVLSGQPISQEAGKSGLHSKRKEQVEVSTSDAAHSAALAEERAVPSSFKDALESLIATAVAGLDTDQLRSLSAHPLGNPTLQLLLRLELTQFGKQRAKDESSIIRVLIPEETLTADSSSSSFVVGLMYDPVGSRLLETIMEYAPAKTFKGIYRGIIYPKLETLVKNDTATYVVSKALMRLGKDELQEAIAKLAPLIPSLVERNRLAIIRTLVDHSVYRQANTEPLAKFLSLTYASPSGFNIIGFLNPSPYKDTPIDQSTGQPIQEQPTSQAPQSAAPTSLKLHASLLAQSLLNAPPPLSPLFLDGLTTLAPPLLLKLAQDTQAAHALVTALSSTYSSVISRRKLISALYGHIASLATVPAGSHVIDALWNGTRGLAFMRERVAEELAEAEGPLRESHYGRRVWRNWRMDMYKRRRREWIAFTKNSATASSAVGGSEEQDEVSTASTPNFGREEERDKKLFVDFPDPSTITTSTSAAAAATTTTTGNKPSRSHAASVSSSKTKHSKHQKHQHRQDQERTSSSFVPAERARRQHMTALEKARERHAQNKARRERELFGQSQQSSQQQRSLP